MEICRTIMLFLRNVTIRETCILSKVAWVTIFFPGQERFTWMTRVYYRDARGCVIMFDLSSRASLASVAKWKRDLDSKCALPTGENVPCLLLANKVY